MVRVIFVVRGPESSVSGKYSTFVLIHTKSVPRTGMAEQKLIACLVLSLSLIWSVGGKEKGRVFSYLLQPMDLSYLGSHKQYFHVYLTSWQDAEVNITIPDTSQGESYYTEHVTLSSNNTWAWREAFSLSTSLFAKAVSRGFRLTSSAPIIGYVLRLTSYSYTYLTAYLALPLTSKDTSFMLGAYLGRVNNNGYSPFYVISAWETAVNYTAYRYQGTPSVPSSFMSGTLEPYQSVFQSTSSEDYFVGLEINTTEPVSVFAGNRRSTIPFSSPKFKEGYYAKPLFQQVPSTPHHGSLYVIGPLPAGVARTAKYSVLVVFPCEDTALEITHSVRLGDALSITKASQSCGLSQLTGRTIVNCPNALARGSYIELENAKSQLPLVLRCSKPCYPLLLKHTDTAGYQQPSGYMALVAPPARIPLPLRFFVPGRLEEHSVDDTYVVVATDKDPSGLSIDGISLSEYQTRAICTLYGVAEWQVALCSVPSGVHTISHAHRNASMSVHIHGYSLKQACSVCYSSCYGFPAFYPDELDSELVTRDKEGMGFKNASTNPRSMKTTDEYYRTSANLTTVLSAVNFILLIVVTAAMFGFIFLVIHIARKYTPTERRPSLPHPDASDHMYLCPVTSAANHQHYSGETNRESYSFLRNNQTSDEEYYCDVENAQCVQTQQ